MSDKARSQPERDKQAAKAGTKASSGVTPKSKPGGEDEDTFEYLAPPVELDELGRLAHYRVLKVLGKGGMGTVFMAEDTRLHRIVALKVMLPSIAKKEVARDRFVREARTMAAIDHDHIITVYSVDETPDGIPYAAMQYLKGVTLEDWLKAGKTLNIPQVMRIGKEIAKGLAAAHSRQLIHRDIKPSNIWLDAVNKGRVKILDFGLARPTNEETHLTMEGMILGTPAYMSPEQARGLNVDERCDLFSLGCVLYRLCAGKLPFGGKDTMSMLLAITSEEPAPVQQIKPDLPAALAQLIHQLLAKKPEDRPASAKAVVQAIQDIEKEWIATGRTTATQPVGGATAKDRTLLDKGNETDPALEESAITELELQATHASGVKSSAPPRGRSWVFAALAGAGITVLSICCCFGVATLTDLGQVNLIADDDDTRAKIPEAGLRLLDHHEKAHVVKPGVDYWLRSGGYMVDPSSVPEGLQVEPMTFALVRQGSVALKVRVVAVKTASPVLEILTADNAKHLQQEWAKHLKRDVVEPNVLNMKMVLIPPGEFNMGSSTEFVKKHAAEPAKFLDKRALMTDYLKNLNAEAPAHAVRITKPYYVGMHEVTYGQFSKFVGAMSYVTEAEKSKVGGTSIDLAKAFELGKGLDPSKAIVRKPEFRWNMNGFKQSSDHPVCNVTWADAEAFCAWLSKKENKRYRLPTEAEWEYACRAGSDHLWHFGDDAKNALAFMWHFQFNLNPKKNPFGGGAHAVGQKVANEFGLFDMHGNVEEMCSDLWSKDYYAKSPPADPKGPTSNPGHGRIAHGGSFLELPYAGRSAYRNAVNANLAHVHVGFRVVCEVE